MKILIPILVSISGILVAGQSNRNIFKRQIVGYSTSVSHEDPHYPDQTALSTVSVSFAGSPLQDLKKSARYTASFHKTPTFEPQTQTIAKNTNTQLFNVGYSVRFKGSANKDVPSFLKPNLDNGEIITGTRKANEQVDIPVGAESTQQFSFNSIDEKKHKLSGIKPKPKFVQPTGKPDNVYLSPTTQKYLKDLEQINKPLFSTNEDAKKYHDQNYSWRNLSPSVEIIRSSEIPTTNNQDFNHADALGRSQSFDFSNGMDYKKKDIQSYQPSASNVFPMYNTYGNQQILPPISSNIPSKPVVLAQLPTATPNVQSAVSKLPLDTSLLRDPYLTTNIQNVPSNPNIVPIHFNIKSIEEVMRNHLPYTQNQDQQTYQQDQGPQTFLQEQGPQTYQQDPGLQTYQKDLGPQTYQKDQGLQAYQPSASQYQPQQTFNYQNPQYQQHQPQPPKYTELSFQNQFNLNDHQFDQSKFLNFNPPKEHYKPTSHEDMTPKEPYHKYQYKIYGKPQPLKNIKHSNYKGTSKDIGNNHRQPRVQTSYKMSLDLRPPPYKSQQFQRKKLVVNYYD